MCLRWLIARHTNLNKHWTYVQHIYIYIYTVRVRNMWVGKVWPMSLRVHIKRTWYLVSCEMWLICILFAGHIIEHKLSANTENGEKIVGWAKSVNVVRQNYFAHSHYNHCIYNQLWLWCVCMCGGWSSSGVFDELFRTNRWSRLKWRSWHYSYSLTYRLVEFPQWLFYVDMSIHIDIISLSFLPCFPFVTL